MPGNVTQIFPDATRVARVYDSLRTAHLERFQRMIPATVIYGRHRYDFDSTLEMGQSRARQMGRLATIIHLFRSDYRHVELSEPLMTGRWLDLTLQIAALRLGARLDGRQLCLGAYCIGLTDPAEKLRDRHRVPLWLGRAYARLVLGRLVGHMDRLAFGTDASRALLARYVRADAIAGRARLFPALSAACDCPADSARIATRVVFVGAFSARKGIRQVMRAWDLASGVADVSLHIIGKGPLAAEVRRWAASRPEVTLALDPPRADVHRALRTAHVLVLLSQRMGYWREQVGLPIVEGLAHGCEIVTTDETGLAIWLGQHGHRVLGREASPEATAAALVQAVASPRSAADVLTDLPPQDPRIAADRWLLGTPPAAEPDGRLPGAPAEGAPPRGAIAHSLPGRAAVAAYLSGARRSVRRYGVHPTDLLRAVDRRPVFVVGSPRSGTSFTAAAIGSVPGFADLGELRPLKRIIPELAGMDVAAASARLRRVIRRSQRLGFVAGRRGIEQTPESTFLIPSIVRAFPDARFVHLVRDGRDVAASLLQLGWVSVAPGEARDEVGLAFGSHARFWVETPRRAEFDAASDATRAAWVWRRYESSARAGLEAAGARSVEIRYEDLVDDPPAVARKLAVFLAAVDRAEDFESALAGTRSTARGRWKRDLSAADLTDIDAEAGTLLVELGYDG